MPEFKTDDQVRVRESSGVWNRRGQVGTVISSYGAGEVDVKFMGSPIRYTFGEAELELARDNSPKPDFQVDDQVLVTRGTRKGERGIVKGTRPNGLRLQFSDSDQIVPYGLSEVELALRPVTLVGVTGRKRAGKDTVAARLIEKYGFKRMAFADNVRKVALAIDPLVAEVTYDGKYVTHARLSTLVDGLGWEKAKEIPEVRRILQKIGTEGIRSLEPDFWIRQVMRQAVFSSAPVVVTDVRFPNEGDAIKKAGGVILRVLRPGMDAQDTHSSETAMDDYLHDWSILNSGTVEELHHKVDELVANGFRPQP